jgi:tripartite-type tricarboxylate transporter receptor subunit TctC
MTSRRAILATPFAAMALPSSTTLAQESFPDRAVRLVVPFTPGGAVDLTGRLLAEMLPPILGQNLIVENRGGAGGNLGGDNVAKAPKDGYSLLLGTATILAANKFLFRKSMPFDPVTDLAPVCRVATGTVLLVVNADRPWKSFADLIKAAKEQPGRLTMGSSGTGSVSHLSLAALNRAAGVDIAHVPYRGGAPALQDLLAGNIDMMFDVIPALMPHVREGRFRALAVGSAQRVTFVPELRDVPGMAELLPGSGIDSQSWYAVMATAGTPANRLAVLHRAVRQVAQSDAFRAKMEPLGFAPVSDESPEAFGRYLRAQEKVWQGLVEVSGATLD